VSTCHDLKLLMLRFVLERSFSDELRDLHAALYVFEYDSILESQREKNLKGIL
jgi:hypothetical protein